MDNALNAVSQCGTVIMEGEERKRERERREHGNKTRAKRTDREKRE